MHSKHFLSPHSVLGTSICVQWEGLTTDCPSDSNLYKIGQFFNATLFFLSSKTPKELRSSRTLCLAETGGRRLCSVKIFVSVQPHCTGCPFPSPHYNGAGIRNSGPWPSARFECCARQHPGHGGLFGKPIMEGVPGLQRDPKAKPPRLTYSIFRSDCHLPAMDSADRRLRPVAV